MNSVSGIVFLILCFRACSSTPVCRGHDEEECVFDAKPTHNRTISPEISPVSAAEIKWSKCNSLLRRWREGTLEVPEWRGTPDEEDLRSDTIDILLHELTRTKYEISFFFKLELIVLKESSDYSPEINRNILERTERHRTTNSVMFANVTETPETPLVQTVLHILNDIMKTHTKAEEIESAFRVDIDGSAEARPIVVTFKNPESKSRVMAARFRLRSNEIRLVVDHMELSDLQQKEKSGLRMLRRGHEQHLCTIIDKLLALGYKTYSEDPMAEEENIIEDLLSGETSHEESSSPRSVKKGMDEQFDDVYDYSLYDGTHKDWDFEE